MTTTDPTPRTEAPARASQTSPPGPPEAGRAGTRTGLAGLSGLGERYGLLLLVAGMAVVFSVLPESGEAFRSVGNARAIAANQGVGLVVALALLLPLAAGHFDFSVGAVAASSSLVTAALSAQHGLPLVVAVLVAVAFGAAVGAALGWLVAYLEVNPFISTLGAATLLGGAIFAYTGGLQITSGIPPQLTAVGSSQVLGVPVIAVVAAAVAVAVWLLTARTAFGRRLYSVGSNARATQLLGVDVRRTQLLAFVGSGTVAAVGGVLLLARQGAATSDSGMSMLFPALTAVLLGTIVVDLGRPSVPGTVIGILFVAVIVSGLALVGAPAWVSPVFNGAALLLAVGFARLARARRGPRRVRRARRA